MQSLVCFVCLTAISLLACAHGVSRTQNSRTAADCPEPGWCNSACRPGSSQVECVDSCFYLADQCCTFCFTSSFGGHARNECIDQCPTTVQTELKHSTISKAQHLETMKHPVTSKQKNTTQGHFLPKVLVPSKSRLIPSPPQGLKITTAHAAVTQNHHHTRHLRKQEPLVASVLAPVAPTADPPPQCSHCQTTSHPEDCSIQCAAMHEACTTNCLVIFEDPSVRQPCIDQCVSLVAVQSKTSFLTPPPAFDVIQATRVTPPPGPALSNPMPPTPRSSPQAMKAANALHENGVVLPDNVGLKLRHHSLNSRPTLTLALL